MQQQYTKITNVALNIIIVVPEVHIVGQDTDNIGNDIDMRAISATKAMATPTQSRLLTRTTPCYAALSQRE